MALYTITVEMEGELGRFAEESLEQFIGGEDTDVNVKLARLE